MKHPLQAIETDENNTARFVKNKIVRFLLDAGPFDMNQLGIMDFPVEDRLQFAQLIGHSVAGFEELPYCTAEAHHVLETFGVVIPSQLKNNQPATEPTAPGLAEFKTGQLWELWRRLRDNSIAADWQGSQIHLPRIGLIVSLENKRLLVWKITDTSTGYEFRAQGTRAVIFGIIADAIQWQKDEESK